MAAMHERTYDIDDVPLSPLTRCSARTSRAPSPTPSFTPTTSTLPPAYTPSTSTFPTPSLPYSHINTSTSSTSSHNTIPPVPALPTAAQLAALKATQPGSSHWGDGIERERGYIYEPKPTPPPRSPSRPSRLTPLSPTSSPHLSQTSLKSTYPSSQIRSETNLNTYTPSSHSQHSSSQSSRSNSMYDAGIKGFDVEVAERGAQRERLCTKKRVILGMAVGMVVIVGIIVGVWFGIKSSTSDGGSNGDGQLGRQG